MDDNNRAGTDEKLWGTIQQIEAKMTPPPRGSKWWPLFREILLRLEQTSERHALAIEIFGSAESAAKSIGMMASKRLGQGAIRLSFEQIEDGRGILYARRGPNYEK